jgi:hypothetical protein
MTGFVSYAVRILRTEEMRINKGQRETAGRAPVRMLLASSNLEAHLDKIRSTHGRNKFISKVVYWKMYRLL